MRPLAVKLILLSTIFFLLGNYSVLSQSAGTYYIESAKSGKLLNVKDAQTANGTPLIIWPYAGGQANERFTLEVAIADYFFIKSGVGKYLHIKDGSDEPKAMVHLWQGYGEYHTKWKFIDAGNGYFLIESMLGTYMDVQNGNNANGTPVWMWTKNSSDAQRWKLIPVGNSPIAVKPTKVKLEIELSDLNVDFHNKDCTRMQGKIEARINDNRLGSTHKPLNNGKILNFEGNKECDFKVREEFNLKRITTGKIDYNERTWFNSIVFEVDKSSLDNGDLILWLEPLMSGGHKGSGPFDFYGCQIKYNTLQSIALNPINANYGITDYSLKFYGDKEHTIIMSAQVVEQGQ